jgi:hypothetical protein
VNQGRQARINFNYNIYIYQISFICIQKSVTSWHIIANINIKLFHLTFTKLGNDADGGFRGKPGFLFCFSPFGVSNLEIKVRPGCLVPLENLGLKEQPVNQEFILTNLISKIICTRSAWRIWATKVPSRITIITVI